MKLVLINGSHSAVTGLALLVDHPQLRISTTRQAAHPESAFDSGSSTNVGVYVVCKQWGSPQLGPGNMSVNHTLSSERTERLSLRLWCDSHRTCIWTTPTLDDKQVLQESVPIFFTASYSRWPTLCATSQEEHVQFQGKNSGHIGRKLFWIVNADECSYFLLPKFFKMTPMMDYVETDRH